MEGGVSKDGGGATSNVDLTDGDAALAVDISDALSERDWVKFTVHTRHVGSQFESGGILKNS